MRYSVETSWSHVSRSLAVPHGDDVARLETGVRGGAVAHDLRHEHATALLVRAVDAEVGVTAPARRDDVGHLGDELRGVPEVTRREHGHHVARVVDGDGVDVGAERLVSDLVAR